MDAEATATSPWNAASDNPLPAILAGSLALCIGLGGFVAWASVADLSSAVVASGYVTAATSRKQIQHEYGGVVEEILVRDGDDVTVGESLVRLRGIEPHAELRRLQEQYDAGRARQARLNAERADANIVVFPTDLMQRRNTSPQSHVRNVVAGQQSVFAARREALQGESAILQARVRQLNDEESGLLEQQRAIKDQQKLIAEELRDKRDLLAKNLIQKPAVLALERAAAQLAGQHGKLIADIARVQNNIGEAELQIVQLRRMFLEEVERELQQVELENFDLSERLAVAQDKVERLEVRSPVDGRVVDLQVYARDAVVRSGDVLMQVVPSERVVIEARVNPTDSDDIVQGQTSDVRLTGLNPRSTPILVGEVIYVSPDALIEPATGEKYFEAQIAVTDEALEKLGGLTLLPGMPADVMIKLQNRTPLQYLLQPISNSLWRAGRES